ncbi:MAG: hypothetical protein VYD09_04915, partial [Chloroflexota bacterium]|nr:hypothetical protein [Chloroflexota bacterium]
MNPIFNSDTHTPPFNYDGVKYEDVQAAIDDAVGITNSIYQKVAEISDRDRTFENTISPLDDVTNLLVETD